MNYHRELDQRVVQLLRSLLLYDERAAVDGAFAHDAAAVSGFVRDEIRRFAADQPAPAEPAPERTVPYSEYRALFVDVLMILEAVPDDRHCSVRVRDAKERIRERMAPLGNAEPAPQGAPDDAVGGFPEGLARRTSELLAREPQGAPKNCPRCEESCPTACDSEDCPMPQGAPEVGDIVIMFGKRGEIVKFSAGREHAKVRHADSECWYWTENLQLTAKEVVRRP